MSHYHTASRWLVLAALALPAFGHAGAQQPAACPTGEHPVPTLGITALECRCAVFVDALGPGRDLFQFDLEPTINGVAPDGPSARLLRANDVIIAVDGVLITTQDGGRRFSAIVPDVPLRLTVRRDGREVEVTVTPGIRCRRVSSPPRPERARKP